MPKSKTSASSPPSHSGDAPRTRRGPLALLAAVLLIFIAAGVGYVILRPSGNGTHRTGASATPTSAADSLARLPGRAVVDSDGLVKTLPNVLAIVRPELPSRVRPGELFNENGHGASPADKQLYIWTAFNDAHGRYLRVSVTRDIDPGVAHAQMLQRRKTKSDQHVSGDGDTTSSGSAESSPGVADEAFSVPETERGSVQPGTGNAAKRYDIGGAYVCARSRNVLVSVDLMGADYPSNAAAKGGSLHGTDLSYDHARQEATGLIKSIVARLS